LPFATEISHFMSNNKFFIQTPGDLNSVHHQISRPISPKAQEIITARKERISAVTASMDCGEHQWVIDSSKIKPMVQAKNMEKFISPKFKMSCLTWQLEAYPNGNTPSTVGSFNLFLRLITMPAAWKNISICRTFTCNETHSGYTAVSRYEKNTSLGWPDFNCSLKDIKNRWHWIKQLTFTITVKILQIRLVKNDGELFYENRVDPYRSLKKQKISWKLDPDTLHEMKQAYFKKGFVSPIYNNMWCLRVYPNGKTDKGDFLVQLQLCALPRQVGKLTVQWNIQHSATKEPGKPWTTDFDFSRSCWGWGPKQLSFESFKQNDEFTITVTVFVDDKINIIAMAEWEKYVRKQNKVNLRMADLHALTYKMGPKFQNYSSNEPDDQDAKELTSDTTTNKQDEEDDHMIGITKASYTSQHSGGFLSKHGAGSRTIPHALHASDMMDIRQTSQDGSNSEMVSMEYMQKRLHDQDLLLEGLSSEMDLVKKEMESLKRQMYQQSMSANSTPKSAQSAPTGNDEQLKKEIASIRKQLLAIKKMSEKNGAYANMSDDEEKELNDSEKVQKWLEDEVKLPQYFDLFIQQGFDDMDGVAIITKEDLESMGISMVGHQRKILSKASKINKK